MCTRPELKPNTNPAVHINGSRSIRTGIGLCHSKLEFSVKWALSRWFKTKYGNYVSEKFGCLLVLFQAVSRWLEFQLTHTNRAHINKSNMTENDLECVPILNFLYKNIIFGVLNIVFRIKFVHSYTFWSFWSETIKSTHYYFFCDWDFLVLKHPLKILRFNWIRERFNYFCVCEYFIQKK